jgi:fatty acid amide hydrolase
MPPIPFDEEVMASTRPLTIGYHVAGGYTHPTPCPTTVRATERVVEALRAAGHQLVPFDPSTVIPFSDLHPILLAQFGVGVRSDTAPRLEPKKERTGNYSSTSTDATVDKIHPDLAAMSSTARGPGSLLPVAESIGKYHEIIAARDRQRDTLNRNWKQLGLDLLICPAWAFPAPPVEEVRNLSEAVWTTQVWNYFDLPAGVVPAGRVTSEDLKKSWDISPDPQLVDQAFKEACLRSREASEGMPVAVQVIGQPWREELVLRGMLEVERAIAHIADELGTDHANLDPVPRRSPQMGDQPIAID